jgi:hypothetical protein
MPDIARFIAAIESLPERTPQAEKREAVKIRKMIGDLDRIVQLLNCDIASE